MTLTEAILTVYPNAAYPGDFGVDDDGKINIWKAHLGPKPLETEVLSQAESLLKVDVEQPVQTDFINDLKQSAAVRDLTFDEIQIALKYLLTRG